MEMKKNYSFFRYANQVSVGDEVMVQRDNSLIPETVINVSNFMLQGYSISTIISVY